MWGYNTKPIHDCAEHLNGTSQPIVVFVSYRIKGIGCVRPIDVKDP